MSYTYIEIKNRTTKKCIAVIPHQDATYLYTAPPKLIGFWIALDDATVENGCLWFSPGSHKSGVHRRYIRNPEKSSKELLIYDRPSPIYQTSNFTPLPVTKGCSKLIMFCFSSNAIVLGTCVLIDGQVVHFSEANKTDKPRNAYTFHIIEQKNVTYSEENWIQLSDGKSFLSLYKN